MIVAWGFTEVEIACEFGDSEIWFVIKRALETVAEERSIVYARDNDMTAGHVRFRPCSLFSPCFCRFAATAPAPENVSKRVNTFERERSATADYSCCETIARASHA